MKQPTCTECGEPIPREYATKWDQTMCDECIALQREESSNEI